MVLELWNRVIYEKKRNHKYIFAFSIALIIYNRNRIIYSEKPDLPGCMASLSIESIDQLDHIMRIAHEIQETTPISYWESDEMNALFGENS